MTLKDRLKVATKKQLQECLDLLEFRQVAIKPFKLSMKLKDKENNGSTATTLTFADDGILFQVKGHSDSTSADDKGYPIYIERYNKEIYVRVWGDINEEDVTENICIKKARNKERWTTIDLNPNDPRNQKRMWEGTNL